MLTGLLASLLNINLAGAQTNTATESTETIEVEESSVVTKLDKRLDAIKGFTAQFNQQVTDSQGTVIQQAEGRLSLLQPNQFVWHTVAPDENKLVSDGETMWFYDPFIEQVTAYSLSEAINSNPILLLLGSEDKNWQQYEVSQLAATHFKVAVKDPEALIGSIEIIFEAESSSVNSLIILDRQGQVSHYRLSEFALKTDFSASFFAFEVPAGVSLDDQR
ncbi:outer membrane lipoprotein chaperone LolA [Catenovulum sp. SM1970]|uniref:outer membrane lipoprotein chaperone LolA n=1 Tax=Marinifaba aquimaris TaxID=2741323 RepID=UPI0015722CC2|nr:outer membrane lipoprotein chaperone LolA [Marinifaba aquimaris]NTS75247.1 outer membrane lipoprotein chaperone LolA [Marinifaba aquimaris]